MKLFRSSAVYVLASILTININQVRAEEISTPQTDLHFEHIDAQFSDFSSDFYRGVARTSRFQKLDNLDLLLKRATNYDKNHDTVEAIGLLIKNISTIRNNINAKSIIGIITLLLEANEVKTAQLIYNLAQSESDPSLVSNLSFAFAKYYFSRNNWQKTIDIIDKIANDLPQQDYQHAMLIEGLSLQNLKKHREALGVYAKINASSKYYTLAQMNMAVANLRQDWWTDAHDIINKLLKEPDVTKNKVLSDRLNTILGYSFLQLEYYRNSRDAFRNVGIDGPYTNQALLGIALDSASQKDYIGALNAAMILKDKKGTDLPVDEANMLLPYFYEKLQQYTTAAAGYSDAIKYFEIRINSINAAQHTDINTYKKYMQNDAPDTVVLNRETINLEKKLPPAFFSQVRLLKSYKITVERMGNNDLLVEYNRLNTEYASTMQSAAEKNLREKSQFITDYMNQCRYGLARMYDNSTSKIE